ncbi:hypothetical protein ACFQ77_22080 [Streptomyces virginiae]|uniref:hypothetical protein n=1 Tax=Streptomyces virginiae TaxID=1961 RepID=UPI00368F08DE
MTTYDVDMFAAEVEHLAQQADQVQGADRVELLARAASRAIDPLRRIELLMLVADAAGRAAHEAAGAARQGVGRPESTPVTYERIGAAAGLSRDVVHRQHTHGAALSWPAARRGVNNGRTGSSRKASPDTTEAGGETTV